MHVHGQCHCGRIAYEAEIDPEDVSACHCSDCQTLSGAPYRVTVRTPAAAFRLLAGQPRLYVKTADSGARRVQAFCPDCGAPIYAAAESNTPAYSLRVGGLRERAQLPPRRQIWCRSAVPWSADLRAVPQCERQ